MMIVAGGLAAAAAHADPGATVEASTAATAQTAMQAAERQCAATTESAVLARFETGTTFTLTDNGLVLLKRPAAKKWYSAVKTEEVEFPPFPNTGN